MTSTRRSWSFRTRLTALIAAVFVAGGTALLVVQYLLVQGLFEDAIGSITSWDTPALDLPRAAAGQLRDLAVQVRNSGICTLENPEYYSYRRDRHSGRFAGIIWREN